jgi:hypothetical protein
VVPLPFEAYVRAIRKLLKVAFALASLVAVLKVLGRDSR